MSRKKRLLLVEDESLIGLLMKKELEEVEFSVMHLLSGELAVPFAINSSEIDLVLMDIDLGSGMDGFSAAEQILSSRSIPLIFLSNHDEPEYILRAREYSSFPFLKKAMPNKEILSTIQEVFVS